MDNINPDHYKRFEIECIDVTAHFNFCRGNAIKYIWRAGVKNPDREIEDLKKAVWYLNYEIARLEENGWDESRIDVIGQNGNTGAHYEKGDSKKPIGRVGPVENRES